MAPDTVILFTSLFRDVLFNQYNGLPSEEELPGLGWVLAESIHGLNVGHTALVLYNVFISEDMVPY
jgi:hypothetical protein